MWNVYQLNLNGKIIEKIDANGGIKKNTKTIKDYRKSSKNTMLRWLETKRELNKTNS